MHRITNVVVKSRLKTKNSLDLNYIIRNIKDAQLQARSSRSAKFPSIIWRDKRIEGSCLLFKSGYICCNGNKSYEGARKSVRQYARLIQKLGIAVRLMPIKIMTISAVAAMAYKIPIAKVAKALGGSYEPELFSALKIKKHGATFMIFGSGKLVIVGLKDISRVGLVIETVLVEIALACMN